MDVTLLTITPEAETIICIVARNSTLSKAHGEENNAKLIRSCIRKGELPILRHAQATFQIQGISRVCSHQLITHVFMPRIQESRRKVKAAKLYSIPPEFKTDNELEGMYHYGMTFMYNLYEKFLEKGATKGAARYCLPEGFATSLTATANMEEWRKIIKDRYIHPDADWEIHNVVGEIFKILKKECPNVFYDLEYNKKELEEGYKSNEKLLQQVSFDFNTVDRRGE